MTLSDYDGPDLPNSDSTANTSACCIHWLLSVLSCIKYGAVRHRLPGRSVWKVRQLAHLSAANSRSSYPAAAWFPHGWDRPCLPPPPPVLQIEQQHINRTPTHTQQNPCLPNRWESIVSKKQYTKDSTRKSSFCTKSAALCTPTKVV